MNWYHGGDLLTGKPKGHYLYVTENLSAAREHAKMDHNGRVFCLRTEFAHLVTEHDKYPWSKVIKQSDLQDHGGVLSVFQEVTD